ncbi:hypothetical protein HanRHA438_Chr09g0418581 [Helianthus annuus]|nr:hypothetical protein HanRHA438_Chr09g0418581 [Helianthus annuus]
MINKLVERVHIKRMRNSKFICNRWLYWAVCIFYCGGFHVFLWWCSTFSCGGVPRFPVVVFHVFLWWCSTFSCGGVPRFPVVVFHVFLLVRDHSLYRPGCVRRQFISSFATIVFTDQGGCEGS